MPGGSISAIVADATPSGPVVAVALPDSVGPPAAGWSVNGTEPAGYPASSALPEKDVASFQIWSNGQDLLNIPVT